MYSKSEPTNSNPLLSSLAIIFLTDSPSRKPGSVVRISDLVCKTVVLIIYLLSSGQVM